MGRDIKAKIRGSQAISSRKRDDIAISTLESRVSAYLDKAKGEKSIGAFATQLGIPKASLARYLNKTQSMTLGTLEKIAAALGVTPSDILATPKK